MTVCGPVWRDRREPIRKRPAGAAPPNRRRARPSPAESRLTRNDTRSVRSADETGARATHRPVRPACVGGDGHDGRMRLPVMPPVAPMLAKSVPTIPDVGHVEPKWDGFRTIVFRDGDEVVLGSRNERPMTRYFPELVESIKANTPERCVIDGEIVIISGDRLDFETLQLRIHPAVSRVKLL